VTIFHEIKYERAPRYLKFALLIPCRI